MREHGILVNRAIAHSVMYGHNFSPLKDVIIKLLKILTYIASLNYMPCNIIYNMNLSIIEGVAAARGKLTRLQKKVTVGEEGLLRQESLNQRGEVGIFI